MSVRPIANDHCHAALGVDRMSKERNEKNVRTPQDDMTETTHNLPPRKFGIYLAGSILNMALRVRTGVVIRLPVAVPNLLDGPHLREQVFLAKKLFPLETRPRPYCSSTNLDSHTQSCLQTAHS